MNPRIFAEDDSTPRLVHDLKGPLSAVSMNIEFALDQLPCDEKFDVVRAALYDCRHAGGRLFRMIANVLDVAKIERGNLEVKMAPVALASLLTKSADVHAVEAEMRGVKLHVELEVGLDSVEADVEILRRVIENLIETSLRYIRSGGNILIAGRQFCATSPVEIIVGNDGPPITAEEEADLFEKRPASSVTADASLTSRMSLYFCRHTIDAMGGTLKLEKTSDYPTCFVIRLPPPTATP